MIGWEHAPECELGVADGETANESWDLEGDSTDAPYVIAIGGGSGDAMVIYGTRDEIIHFVDRLHRMVHRVPADALVVELFAQAPQR
jgi:hypothetical protein